MKRSLTKKRGFGKRFRKSNRKSAYDTIHKAVWKSVRPGAEVTKRESVPKYPIANAVYKTIGRRYSRYKKKIFAGNRLRGYKSEL